MASRFAIATFKRVFDTTPARDVLTLQQLTSGLLRFQTKPKMARQVQRDIQRIEEAWASYERGERLGGRRWGILVRAAKKGGKEGARAAYERLVMKAHGRIKTDLRLWSPALYEEGKRRESDNVIHISCLVQDFDAGIGIEEASAIWSDWYHIVHTTWSHTTKRPKFRLCLPLAQPVLAADWREVWTWGSFRVGQKNDQALKSVGSTFALPTVENEAHPRQGFVRPGRLLDPLAEGVVKRAAFAPPDLPPQPVSHFRGDPKESYIDHPSQPFVEAEPPDGLDVADEDFDLFGPPDTAPRERSTGASDGEPDGWEDEFEDLF